MNSFNRDLSKLVSILCLAIGGLMASYVYGVISSQEDLPPSPLVNTVYENVREVFSSGDRWLDVTENVAGRAPVETPLPGDVQAGLVVVAGDVETRKTAVRVIDRDGEIVQEWRPFWKDVWGRDEGQFPSRPVRGMYLHGVAVLPDGSLVANFEHQSTFRMDVCGNVLWKLDNLGHHSVFPSHDGTLWVAAEERYEKARKNYPFHGEEIRAWTIQQIDLDGNILRTIPVIDILFANDLAGLLYLSNLRNIDLAIDGDTLHLNDVDIYPPDMASEIFAPGDIMMSLRNINAIVVVDGDSLELKFLSVGRLMRQHDPDFMPGDRISVFDNRAHTRSPVAGPARSRIVEIDARSGTVRSVLDGAGETAPFFTRIMGMHQRLPNGNILLVSSDQGRAFEFTGDGRLAWRYDNRTAPEKNQRLYMAGVLPTEMDRAFFDRARAGCDAEQS